MIWIWCKRILFSSKDLLKLETTISLISLILGVACLLITMTIVSSYETTLKKTLIDRTGHFVFITKKDKESVKNFPKLLEPWVKEPYDFVPFISVEALALNKGRLQGILLEGVDTKKIHSVLNIKNHLMKGRWIENPFEVVIGKQLASQLDLDIGSLFYISYAKLVNQKEWLPKAKKFFVSGIVNLGRHDFNSRYVLTSLPSIQHIVGYPSDEVMGFRLRFHNDSIVTDSFFSFLKNQFDLSFWIQDWKAINQNLFTAIQMEKILIFFVLLILVVAAGFNISNQLFLGVLKRFRDIGILKAMGAKHYVIVQLFLIPGLAISVVGTAIGLLFGSAVCYALVQLYDIWGQFIPSDVYQLNTIILDFRWKDFVVIFVFSVCIGLLSSMIPIKKALKLSPKEGLSVES